MTAGGLLGLLERLVYVLCRPQVISRRWFEEGGGTPIGPGNDRHGIPGRAEHLFDAVRNPNMGELFTNAEVARMTLGDLWEEDVEGIRTGAIADPTVGQMVALAAVFGVEPSYLLDRGEPGFDGELVEALRDWCRRLHGASRFYLQSRIL